MPQAFTYVLHEQAPQEIVRADGTSCVEKKLNWSDTDLFCQVEKQTIRGAHDRAVRMRVHTYQEQVNH